MNTIIQFRRGTADEWTAVNPTLAVGEVGYETDTTKIKIGDGSQAWNDLGYVPIGSITESTTTDLNGLLFGDGSVISAVAALDGGDPDSFS